MKNFDLEYEKTKWEHPFRIQVSKPLRRWQIGSVIEDLQARRISCAVEQRGERFIVWRQPEPSWDVDHAPPEWVKEWTSQAAPALENIIAKFEIEGEQAMPYGEMRIKRDREIYNEFKYLKSQGFRLKHIFNVLGEKYFLGYQRVRDIVYTEQKNEQNR